MSRPAASLGLIRMIEAVPDRLDGSPRQLRRFWSDEFKATAVEQACQPGVNMSAVARQIGILPSQLYRWRRELLGSDESGLAAAVDPQSVAPDPDPVVEIDIDGIFVRVGRHVEEAHLQRVIRAVRSA
ncbi:putative transposase [Agrobacterium rubi TR3 = NBRC 13261]|uniref:Putative transposase n=1 Tax=Agrobacterium rubi TR3 = NBRC 13261 TaxID=1368415 RepID=A0A081D3M1_9HYPH|nr:transposase [Agrobacterium rubi]MBP1881723.1 transposase [Agrobacterium rubi]GAK73517.1 putative transposase [Agrobacterium rubi TR3 = NBRC 13261]